VTPEAIDYAVVTTARNEAADLPRLASALIAQTVTPSAWVIVDHGSTDETGRLAAQLADEHPWIRVVSMTGEATPTRGGPIVQAFNAGLAALDEEPGLVVKVDADVAFDPDHFERMLAEFSRDASLGMASSTCWEKENGIWTAKRVGRSHVRGAVRAYRWACFEQLSPLEERMGWDTIDEIKAQLHGWTTRSIADLAFFHFRATGARDGGRRAWESQGDLAWFLDYRVSYLLFRTAFRSLEDPRALFMLSAWGGAAVRREPRYPDLEVRRFLRAQQTLWRLPQRADEVVGRRRNPLTAIGRRVRSRSS
jgi:poly-beta-1,6-N-acetyl-D-glucosamine synthase